MVPENIFKDQMTDWEPDKTFSRSWLQTWREEKVDPASSCKWSNRLFKHWALLLLSLEFWILRLWGLKSWMRKDKNIPTVFSIDLGEQTTWGTENVTSLQNPGESRHYIRTEGESVTQTSHHLLLGWGKLDPSPEHLLLGSVLMAKILTLWPIAWFQVSCSSLIDQQQDRHYLGMG